MSIKVFSASNSCMFCSMRPLANVHHPPAIRTGAISAQFKSRLMAKNFSTLKCKNRLGFNQKTTACKSFSLEVLCHSRDWKWRRFGLDSLWRAFHSSEIFLFFPPCLFLFLPHTTLQQLHSLLKMTPFIVKNKCTTQCGVKSVFQRFRGCITENWSTHEKPSGPVPVEYHYC